MEKLSFANTYSLKNIHLPSEIEYRKKLVSQTEKFMRRFRWHAYFTLLWINGEPQDEDTEFLDENSTKNYGFRSKSKPLFVKELEKFEHDLFELIKNIRFRSLNNDFLNSLKSDIQKLRSTKNVFLPADKTRNMYAISKPGYQKLLFQNITKSYMKTSMVTVNNSDIKSAKIAKDLGLENRMTRHTMNNSHILLKDTKPEFMDRMPCRLINPSKSSVQKVSKEILDEINMVIRSKTGHNQWKNTNAVLTWFKSLNDKASLRFFKFDVCEFYPSITAKLLNKALKFASKYVVIPENHINVIFQGGGIKTIPP